MKKNFDFRLTIFLVSLFIGLLLIILGNKNNYCLSFGLLILGVSLGLYSTQRTAKMDKLLAEIQDDIEDTPEDDKFTMRELNKLKKKVKKQRRSIVVSFMSMAIVLIILGITLMI